MMEVETFMELYDGSWFEKQIFKKQEHPSSFTSSESNQDDRFREKPLLAPEFARNPSTISRSMSERLHSKLSFDSGYSVSPNSVLVSPKLQKILSSKEVAEEENSYSNSTQPTAHVQEIHKRKFSRRRSAKRDLSKSLSELEFKELKGFMDLGFVFAEEDKDSSLVSIIPGLQRLGKQYEEESSTHVVSDKEAVSRPYLSEAWEIPDRKNKVNPLTNWSIPSLNNEIDIKDNLRWWAHTVASAVR